MGQIVLAILALLVPFWVVLAVLNAMPTLPPPTVVKSERLVDATAPALFNVEINGVGKGKMKLIPHFRPKTITFPGDVVSVTFTGPEGPNSCS
jgi:hypothetical protein